MKKALFVLLLSMLIASPSFAQTDSLRHEIGFSTQIILENLFNSGNAPLDFMYKSQRPSGKWLRAGMNISFGSHDIEEHPDDEFSSRTTESRSIGLNPSLGIEWRKQLSKKLSILYGGDITGSYANSKYIRTSTYSDTQNGFEDINSTEDKSQSYGGSFRPFLGLIYHPLPRLYFSTEASAYAGFSYSKTRSECFHNGTETSGTDFNRRSTSFHLSPASAIFVYYRF